MPSSVVVPSTGHNKRRVRVDQVGLVQVEESGFYLNITTRFIPSSAIDERTMCVVHHPIP